MACDAATADAEMPTIPPPSSIDVEWPMLFLPVPPALARPSSTAARPPQSAGRRRRRRIWRGRRLTRSPGVYPYRPEGDDYEVAFPQVRPLPQGENDGSRGGGPATSPTSCSSAHPAAAATTAVLAAEPTNWSVEPRGDRPASPERRPGVRARVATAAEAATASEASVGAAAPRGERLPAWAVIQRGKATAQLELEVLLVVPLRWTAAGCLVVRPPIMQGSRLNAEEEEVVSPERVVIMGPPNGQLDGRRTSDASAAPREVPHPPERQTSAQPHRRMSPHSGTASSSDQIGHQSHDGEILCRRRLATSAGGPIPLLREQHSAPQVAFPETRAWVASSHVRGPAIASVGERSLTPSPARVSPIRKVSGEPQEKPTDEEDPTVAWRTSRLFPTLSPPAGDVSFVRVDTESVPRPQTQEDNHCSPERLPLPPALAEPSNRCVVSFSTPLPVAGLPSAVAFSFLGVLAPSLSTVGSVTSLRLEWATLRFAAAAIDGGIIGDLGGGRRGSAAAAVVDMVDFGVRLQGTPAAAAGWVVAEVEPRPGCDATLLTTRAPDVSVAAGPSGVSVSRGGGSSVESVRAPYAVAATVGTHGVIAHTADWRWELKCLDDGSPYYAQRDGRRVRVGGRRRIVAATAAPVAATQSHASPAGALHASWTAPAANVAAAPTLAFEVYVRPRVVQWPRGGLGASVRLAMSRSEPRLSSGIEYTQAFTLTFPVGQERDTGTTTTAPG